MDTIIGILDAWKDLVVTAFAEDPLSASLLALLAIGGFLAYEQRYNRDWDKIAMALHGTVALIAWAIATPILAHMLRATGDLLDFLAGLVVFLYERFERQPIVVLVILAVAIVGYFVLARIGGGRFRAAWLLRGLVCVAGFFVLTALVVPIADQFDAAGPAAASSSQGK